MSTGQVSQATCHPKHNVPSMDLRNWVTGRPSGPSPALAPTSTASNAYQTRPPAKTAPKSPSGAGQARSPTKNPTSSHRRSKAPLPQSAKQPDSTRPRSPPIAISSSSSSFRCSPEKFLGQAYGDRNMRKKNLSKRIPKIVDLLVTG